jgi:hypothetical protein
VARAIVEPSRVAECAGVGEEREEEGLEMSVRRGKEGSDEVGEFLIVREGKGSDWVVSVSRAQRVKAYLLELLSVGPEGEVAEPLRGSEGRMV